MVRLGRETSNSFGADLFETLEDWESYLQAEQIDFEDLSKSNATEALSETNTNKAEIETPARLLVKPSVQRLEP